jgi:ABC-type polysaccharide/polyol phosphate export permease
LSGKETWWFHVFRTFLTLNPLSYFLALIRDPVYFGRLPDARTMAVAAGMSLVSLFLGYKIFQRLAPRHVHYL